ncbi:hypothetical protein Plec18170_003498 [Paecilomyces lecythidis]
MKLAILSALFVAAASANTLKLYPMAAKIMKDSNTGRLDFTVVDESDNVSTTCSATWDIGDNSARATNKWYPCSNPDFSLNLPKGASSIESFSLTMSHALNDKVKTGETSLNAHDGTGNWVCTKPGHTAGTSEECGLGQNIVVNVY